MKHLLTKSLWAITLRVASAVVAYVSIIVLARWLSPKDFGLWGSTISALTFLGVLAGLGMPMALLRFIPQDQINNDGLTTRAIIRFAAQKTLRAACAISGVAALLAAGLYLSGFANDAGPAQTIAVVGIGLVLLPAFVSIDLYGAVIRSFGGLFWAISPRELLWRLALMPLVLIAVSLVPSHPYASYMVLAALCLFALAYVQYLRARKMVPDGDQDQPQDLEAGKRTEINGVSKTIWISVTANFGLNNLDIICVALFLSPEIAAPYFVVSRTASLLSFALNAINVFLGPILSAAYYEGDLAKAQNTARFGAIMAFLPAVVAFAILVFYGKQVLALFNPTFAVHLDALLILSLAHLINATVGSCGLLLNMSGHEKVHAKASTFVLAALLVCLPVATTQFGLVGTALCVATLSGLQSAVLWQAARKLTGVNSSIFSIFTRKA